MKHQCIENCSVFPRKRVGQNTEAADLVTTRCLWILLCNRQLWEHLIRKIRPIGSERSKAPHKLIVPEQDPVDGIQRIKLINF